GNSSAWPSQGSPPGTDGGRVLAAGVAVCSAAGMASGRRGPWPTDPALGDEEPVLLLDRLTDRRRLVAELRPRLTDIRATLHPEDPHRAGGEALRRVRSEAAHGERRDVGDPVHQRRGQAQPRARAAGDHLVDVHELVHGLELAAEDVLVPGASLLHGESMALGDVARRDELEA